LVAIIKVKLVAKTGASTWLNSYAKIEVVTTFLCKQ
jgi:hypothetical protein